MHRIVWYVDRKGRWKPVKLLSEQERKQSELLWKEIQRKINGRKPEE